MSCRWTSPKSWLRSREPCVRNAVVWVGFEVSIVRNCNGFNVCQCALRRTEFSRRKLAYKPVYLHAFNYNGPINFMSNDLAKRNRDKLEQNRKYQCNKIVLSTSPEK